MKIVGRILGELSRRQARHTDRRTDRQTDGRTDAGNDNTPSAILPWGKMTVSVDLIAKYYPFTNNAKYANALRDDIYICHTLVT